MSDKRDKPADPDPDATVTFKRSDLTPPADPEATVAIQRSSLLAPPEDDATVMIPAGGLPGAAGARSDDDATVMIPPRATPAYDEDATVMMPPKKETPIAKAPVADEDATVVMKPKKETPVADEDATVMMSPISAAEARGIAGAASAAAIAATSAPPVAVPTVAAAPTPASDPQVTLDGTGSGSPAPVSRMPWIVGAVVLLLAGLFFGMRGGKAPGPEVPSAPMATPAAPVTANAPAPAAATTAAPPTAPTSPAVPEAPSADLKTLLSDQIKQKHVALAQSGGATMITFSEARQFSSGDVDPNTALKAVMLEVAAGLDKIPGGITVIGHSDDTPTGSARYPSNQALSAARADAVVTLMASKLGDLKRIKAEGAGATKPMVPNNSVANRAKNRRVVIVLNPAP